MTDLYWFGCYRDVRGSDGLFTPESVSHPAKMSGGLLFRILDEAEARGWFRRGMTLLDPFYGVGTTGLARLRGYDVVGVELEQRFVDMADGCECTGVTKADWVRYFQPGVDLRRRHRANYRDGRHWCPRCLRLGYEPRGPTLFGEPATTGVIPCEPPHHYEGNRERLERLAGPGIGRCVVIQGDSRDLVDLLAQRSPGAVVTSPPYGGFKQGNREHDYSRYGGGGQLVYPQWYGCTPGQIEDLPDGVVTSPPWENSEGSLTPRKFADVVAFAEGMVERDACNPRRHSRSVEAAVAMFERQGGYGGSDGQIGRLSGETYQEAMLTVYCSIHDVLAPGAVAAVVVKCPTRNGRLRRLDVNTWHLLQTAGFACWCPVCQEWVAGQGPHDHPEVDRGVGPVCGYRAVLAEELVQSDLLGDRQRRLAGRVSFFKRHWYNRGRQIALWEDVIFALR